MGSAPSSRRSRYVAHHHLLTILPISPSTHIPNTVSSAISPPPRSFPALCPTLTAINFALHTGTIGIGIISYAGGISIAVSADRVPGSEGVTRRICESFERRFALYVARAKEVLDHQD